MIKTYSLLELVIKMKGRRPEKQYSKAQIKCINKGQDSQSSLKNPFQKIRLQEQFVMGNFQSNHIQNNGIELTFGCEHTEFVESMQRRCQLQLSKEKQLNSILSNKFQQQIDFLKLQNLNLKALNQGLNRKLDSKLFDSQMSTSRSEQNSFVVVSQVSNLKSMLSVLQRQHEHCLSSKKDLLDMKQTLGMKIKILEEENQQLQTECKQYKKKTLELNQISKQNENYQNECQVLKKEIQSLRSLNQLKEMQFNKQLSTLQKAIQDLQYQNQNSQIVQKQNHPKNLLSLQSQSSISQKYTPHKLQHEGLKNTQLEITKKDKVLQQINAFFPNSFQKNSFNNRGQCYTKDQKCLEEKEIIEGLYRKSLCLLEDREQPVRLQNLNPSKNIKIQAIYNATKSLSNHRMTSGNNNFSFSQRYQSNLSNNQSSTKRRFKYL